MSLEKDECTTCLINNVHKRPETKGLMGWMRQKTIIVEPLLILYIAASKPMTSIRSQLMYQKVGESMGNDVKNFTSEGSQCENNITSESFINQQKVQSTNASLELYISLATFLPSIIALCAYGILGDRIGRRLLLILPCLGAILKALLYISIIKFNLPVYFFFLEPLEYFFGGIDALILGTYAYISDTVPSERRSLRMTILDVLSLANGAIASMIVGNWIKAQGFFWPLIFVICINSLALLYSLFLILKQSTIMSQASNIPSQPIT
jgi:PCFT/HCP family folate transporter-like MFS transporter 1/3